MVVIAQQLVRAVQAQCKYRVHQETSYGIQEEWQPFLLGEAQKLNL
jgi:hypothetical protein